jgi:predicted phage baseplate assembly protein
MLQDGYETDVPPGTRAQTLPAPGEVPESFETGASLNARAVWNNLQPRQTRPQVIEANHEAPVYLDGTALNLKPNDPLLLVFGKAKDQQEFRRVKMATPEPAFNRTKVELQASPVSAATAAVSAAARQLIEHNLHPARVASPQSELGGEVIEILRDAEARRNVSMTRHELATWFGETLTQLRRRHEVARDRKYGRLEEWIRDLIRDLEELVRRLPPAGTAPPAPRPPAPPAWPTAIAGFDALLAALAKPPSVPPASPSALAPTVGEIFAPGSDQQAELLAALHPAAGSPYKAWANAKVSPPSPVQVHALRLTSPLFGHAAPKRLLPNGRLVEWPVIEYPDEKSKGIPHEHPDIVDLDGSHPEVLPDSNPGGLPDSWIVVQTRRTPLTDEGLLIARVQTVDASLSRADYGISGSITRITLRPGGWIHLETKDEPEPTDRDERIEELDEQDDFNAIRYTVAYTHSELLPQAEAPILADVQGTAIELGGVQEGLRPGRWLVVTGDRTDVPNTTVAGGELVMLEQVEQSFDPALPGDRVHSTLHLANGLAFNYARGSARVYGNVIPATAGESHREVLGSGDASRPSQQFTLRHPYLTFVPARNARGTQSTLHILVDDIPWQEAASLAAAGPRDHVFTTHTADDGKTTVAFGDGHHGARLSSGSENVVALYRSASGKAFTAPAGKITLLATKPLGVKEVVNPLDVAPGSSPESRDSGRRNAPLGVALLDRLVSVHDYEEFSLGFGGVGKASATRLWDGRHEIVHVTVAGMDDSPLPADSQMLQSLVDALQLSGDRSQPVQVAPREFLFLVISANVTLAPGFIWDTVSKAIRQRLADRFGFDARGFGQDVVGSEVISAIQSLAGVASAQLVILDAVPESITAVQLANLATKLRLRPRIRARLARLALERDRILPAQLCVLNPDLKGTLLLSQVMG